MRGRRRRRSAVPTSARAGPPWCLAEPGSSPEPRAGTRAATAPDLGGTHAFAAATAPAAAGGGAVLLPQARGLPGRGGTPSNSAAFPPPLPDAPQPDGLWPARQAMV